MTQKVQKTVEILQVPFIDRDGKDKCQRSRRYANSWKFTDRIVDVPVVLKRQCQRKIRTSVHKQVRRQVQRQDSRERVVSGSRRNGSRSV